MPDEKVRLDSGPFDDARHALRCRMRAVIPRIAARSLLSAALVLIAARPGGLHAEVTDAQREMYERLLDFPSMVVGGDVTPIWCKDGSRFIYASSSGAQRRFVEVDPASGERQPFFDGNRLRDAIEAAGVRGVGEGGAPFETFSFENGDQAVRFEIQGRKFDLMLSDYKVRELPPEEVIALKRREPQVIGTMYPAGGPIAEVADPGNNFFLRVQDHNLWLRDAADNRLKKLTDDGVERYEWNNGERFLASSVWAPDGNTVAAFKVDKRQVHYMPVVHWLKRQEEVSYHMYAQTGGRLPQQQLHFVDVLSGEKVAVEMGEDAAYFRSAGWHPNKQEFLYFWLSRNGKRVELRAAHRATGRVRVLWSDEKDTFAVATMRFSSNEEPDFKMLSDGRFIVSSERSGWNQLYLYGPDKGGKIALAGQLTRGEFPVKEILRVDEKRGLVYFTAHNDPKRLYDTHLMRVSLKGGDLEQLTTATGLHQIQFSPSGDYFLDTHSTVRRPPVTELRRFDGTLVASLEAADISGLTKLGWQPPEEFVVKAADGKTDLYGIVHKPANFDPDKKYPVVEYIYAGPQTINVPKAFSQERLPGHMTFTAALAQLGFVTFIVDGRGTPDRSKAFQDVVYGNLGRYEIADHAAALRQVAQTRRYMDMDRVGIFGTSYGGYFTTRALVQAGDLYKVGVASAPAIDLHTPFALAIENYMGGRPQEVPEAYEYADNVLWADRLQGKYLILQATGDVNVPFAQPMQMIEGLIKAGKRYDLNVFPEGDHGFKYQDSVRRHVYWQNTIRDYFIEHLQP